MATFNIIETRDESGSINKGTNADAISIQYSLAYKMEVTSPQPETVRAIDALYAPGLPVVNRSIYRSGGFFIPYLVCNGKTARRDPNNVAIWEVTATYATGERGNNTEGDNQPQPLPVAITDIAPREESQLGEVELVRYQDKDDKVCATPTGNLFPEPFVERIPTLELRITQYENSITYQQMLDRKFKVNENTYRGQPPYDWLISQVEATEVEVTLADESTQSAALVTYTLLFNNMLYGFRDDRALIDTHYIDKSGTSDVKRAFKTEDEETYIPAFLNVAGDLKYPTAPYYGVPDYDQWAMQDRIDFDTFLQV